MLSVEEALDRVLTAVPVLGTEVIPLPDALGRALAEPIDSTRDLPPWPNSSMDGYAVRSDDLQGAEVSRPVRLRVVGEIPAGAVAQRPLRGGESYRILTGAPLPPGADAVVPQEEVERDGDQLGVARPAAPGAYVRPRGEDIRAGDRVLEPGTTLGPAALAVLAALGRPVVRVYRTPRVAVLSTGDELVDIGTVPGPGQIPNSNSYALGALVRASRAHLQDLGIARDDPDAIEARLRAGLAADVLVSSAGVSVGDRDFVREALDRLGARVDFWKVSMRPGKPMTFALIGNGGTARAGASAAGPSERADRPFFGLPGNPVSCMVTFELFVRPALRRMGGYRVIHPPRVRARAGEAIDNPGPRRGYLRVQLAGPPERLTARPTGEQGSGILRSMLLADGLAVVAPDTRIAPGEPVEVILLRDEGLGGVRDDGGA